MSECNALNGCDPTALARQQATYGSAVLVQQLFEQAARQRPACRKALADLAREPAFAKRSPGQKEAVLRAFLQQSGKAAFLAGVKSLLHQAGAQYATLNACEQQILLKGMARSAAPEKTAGAYRAILTDLPFSKASAEARAVVLGRPGYYAPRTMNRLVRDAGSRLPDDWAFVKHVGDYRAGLQQRFEDKGTWRLLDRVVQTRATLRSYFLERWYNPSIGDRNKTVGEQYRVIPGLCWVSKLYTAKRHWAAFVAQEVIELGPGNDTLPWGHRPFCER